jgi:hypothetical protein
MASLLEKYGALSSALYPIRIGLERHLIDKDGVVDNQEVFKAVCNGYTIDLSVMKD